MGSLVTKQKSSQLSLTNQLKTLIFFSLFFFFFPKILWTSPPQSSCLVRSPPALTPASAKQRHPSLLHFAYIINFFSFKYCHVMSCVGCIVSSFLSCSDNGVINFYFISFFFNILWNKFSQGYRGNADTFNISLIIYSLPQPSL